MLLATSYRWLNAKDRLTHWSYVSFALSHRYDIPRIIHTWFRLCRGLVWAIYPYHYNDVIMSAMTSRITSLTIVYSSVYSGADQRKHQSSASLAFVRGIHRWWPVNSPHKGPVTRKMFHLLTSSYSTVTSRPPGQMYECQGAVSLTFCELPKILSRKYTTPEITFMVRISIWKFVRVPKARLWAYVQSFSLKFSSQVLFMQYTNFERIFWRARETLVKQPPGYQP